MKKMLGYNELSGSLFIKQLQVFKKKKQFEERFLQFTFIEPIIFLYQSFYLLKKNKCNGNGYIIADFIQDKTEEIKLENLNMKNDIMLKSLISEDFRNTVEKEKFPFLKKGDI